MKRDKKYPDTYWNHGVEPIFIHLGVVSDPNGGPGKGKTTICVAPGDGINFQCTDLKPYKPKKSK